MVYYVHRVDNKEVKKIMTKQKQYPFIGDIVESINALDNMEDLNKVIGVLKQKQTSLRAQLVAELKTGFVIGQPVKINSKGKILDGFITKINRTKCVVKINNELFNVPMSIMEVA
jgi:hypothetical protein